MRTIAVHREDGAAVCGRCVLADRAVARARGLLGRDRLAAGEGMLLVPGGSIHTFFMRFPIDVVFLDRANRVVGVRSTVRPWRMRFALRAKKTLELAAGEIERVGVAVGDRLLLET